jgi:hypothetical protein
MVELYAIDNIYLRKPTFLYSFCYIWAMGRFSNNKIPTEWFTFSKLEYYDSRFKYYAGGKRKPLLKSLEVDYTKKPKVRMRTFDWPDLDLALETSLLFPFDSGSCFKTSRSQHGPRELHSKYEELNEITKDYKNLVAFFYNTNTDYLEAIKLNFNYDWVISESGSYCSNYIPLLNKDTASSRKKVIAHPISLSEKIYSICNERLREREFAGRHIKAQPFHPFNKDVRFFPDLLKEKLKHLERARILSIELGSEYHSGKRRELKRLELIVNSETTFIKHILITGCFTQDRVIAVLLNTISLLRKKIKLLSKLLSALLSRINRFTRFDIRLRFRSIIRFLFKNMDDTDKRQMIELNNNHLKTKNHIIHVKTRNNCPAPGNLQRREPWTYQRAA